MTRFADTCDRCAYVANVPTAHIAFFLAVLAIDDDLLGEVLATVARPGRAPTDAAREFYPAGEDATEGGYWMDAHAGDLAATHWLPEPADPRAAP